MIPNESDLEELPDKEFKGRITDRFRQLREARNVLQEHKNERMNGIKTSIQNMRIEFNKERIAKAKPKEKWRECNASLRQSIQLSGQSCPWDSLIVWRIEHQGLKAT